MTKSTSQVLQEARQLIEQGWCQGSHHQGPRHARRHCIVGAVNLSARRGSERARAFDALAAALPSGCHRYLPGFNDMTTQADVLALFDRALVEVTK